MKLLGGGEQRHPRALGAGLPCPVCASLTPAGCSRGVCFTEPETEAGTGTAWTPTQAAGLWKLMLLTARFNRPTVSFLEMGSFFLQSLWPSFCSGVRSLKTS